MAIPDTIRTVTDIKNFVDLGWELRLADGKAALFYPSETNPEIVRACTRAALQAIGEGVPFQPLILGTPDDPGI